MMKNCESPVSSPELAIARRPGLLKVRRRVELVGNRGAGAAGAVAVRVAALGHEPVEDAVESQPVVEALVDERDDPRGGDRGEAVEEPEGQVAGEGRAGRVLAGDVELDGRPTGDHLDLQRAGSVLVAV